MKSNLVIQRFKEANSLTGVLTRVADTLGVSAQHVREVALGRRTSERVMQALTAEVDRIRQQEAKGVRKSVAA